MVRKSTKSAQANTGFSLLANTVLGLPTPRKFDSERQLVRVAPDVPQPPTLAIPQPQYFALVPTHGSRDQFQLCASPAPINSVNTSPAITRVATPQPIAPQLPERLQHAGLNQTSLSGRVPGSSLMPTPAGDSLVVTFRLPTADHDRHAGRNLSRSRSRERRHGNHESFTARHICAGCGKIRSASYHYRHSLVPGQMLQASFCRRCLKDITSEETDVSGEDGDRRKEREGKSHRSSERRSRSKRNSSSGSYEASNKSRRSRHQSGQHRRMSASSDGSGRESLHDGHGRRKAQRKRKSRRHQSFDSSSPSVAEDIGRNRRRSTTDMHLATDKIRRRLRIRISEESSPERIRHSVEADEIRHSSKADPLHSHTHESFANFRAPNSRPDMHESERSRSRSRSRISPSRARHFVADEMAHYSAADHRHRRSISPPFNQRVRYREHKNDETEEGKVDGYHRTYRHVAEDFPSDMEQASPMVLTSPRRSHHQSRRTGSYIAYRSPTSDSRSHAQAPEFRRHSAQQMRSPRVRNGFDHSSSDSPPGTRPVRRQHSLSRQPVRCFTLEDHDIDVPFRRTTPISVSTPRQARRGQPSSWDSNIAQAGSRHVNFATGPPQDFSEQRRRRRRSPSNTRGRCPLSRSPARRFSPRRARSGGFGGGAGRSQPTGVDGGDTHGFGNSRIRELEESEEERETESSLPPPRRNMSMPHNVERQEYVNFPYTEYTVMGPRPVVVPALTAAPPGPRRRMPSPSKVASSPRIEASQGWTSEEGVLERERSRERAAWEWEQRGRMIDRRAHDDPHDADMELSDIMHDVRLAPHENVNDLGRVSGRTASGEHGRRTIYSGRTRDGSTYRSARV